MTRQLSSHGRSRAKPAASLVALLAVLGGLLAAPATAAAPKTPPKTAVETAPKTKPKAIAPAWLVVHTGGDVVRRPNPVHYPYAAQPDPHAADPWGSTERQCVGYATWWLNAAGVNFGRLTKGPSGRIGQFADAKDWAAAARVGGWRVSTVPKVGAVAQWSAGEQSRWTIGNVTWTSWAGSAGHVAIVTAVYPDQTVQVSEYNSGGNRSYRSERTRAPRYLYLGV